MFTKDVLYRSILIAILLISWTTSASFVNGQDDPSRFETSDSRSDYVHRIELYDSMNTRILPGGNGNPYSPKRTCGRCHDYARIATGFHFSPDGNVQNHGRAGEPWIWLDETTGTQIPMSFRQWSASYVPWELGISNWEFVHKFGGRTPGGYPGVVKENVTTPASDPIKKQTATVDRFHLSGDLDIDCMICHSRGSVFDVEAWSKQIEDQNFAWASTVAIGLAKVVGQVRRLDDDFDVAASQAEDERGETLPTTEYDTNRFDVDGKVFFDVVRFPSDNACYRCHSSLSVGNPAQPRWNHDSDVHIRAGFQCVDCHRNDLGHNIVRGFEGEIHPGGQPVANLSCRGCHMETETKSVSYQGGGRMGAPHPQHKGLPPIHLEKLSCTTCHAGSIIGDEAELVQTSLAHFLGRKDRRKAHQQPEIVQPVLMPNDEQVLYPYRVMWPSYWGTRTDGKIAPLNPNTANDLLKSSLRVRTDFLEETTKVRLSRAEKAEVVGDDRARLNDGEYSLEEKQKLAALEMSKGLKQFNEKMEKSLLKLMEYEIEDPVYVSGNEIFALDENNKLKVVTNPDAQPYSWPIAHDVRPARWALGARGCQDCHSDESPFFYANVVTQSPVPDASPTVRPMHEYANLDADLLGIWNRSFQGRTAFKWTAVFSIASVASIIIVFGLFLFAGVYRGVRRTR